MATIHANVVLITPLPRINDRSQSVTGDYLVSKSGGLGRGTNIWRELPPFSVFVTNFRQLFLSKVRETKILFAYFTVIAV